MNFILELRRKKKTHSISTFILQYSSKVFFFFFHYLKWIIIMDIYVQSIIVTFYNELIIIKVLQQLCYNIYIYIYIYMYNILQNHLIWNIIKLSVHYTWNLLVMYKCIPLTENPNKSSGNSLVKHACIYTTFIRKKCILLFI